MGDDCTEGKSKDTKDPEQTKQTPAMNILHNRRTGNTLNLKSQDTVCSAEKDSSDSSKRSHERDNYNEVSASQRLLSSKAGAGDDKDAGEKDEVEKQAAAGDTAQSSHPGVPVDRGWAWVIMMGKRTMIQITIKMMTTSMLVVIFYHDDSNGGDGDGGDGGFILACEDLRECSTLHFPPAGVFFLFVLFFVFVVVVFKSRLARAH